MFISWLTLFLPRIVIFIFIFIYIIIIYIPRGTSVDFLVD